MLGALLGWPTGCSPGSNTLPAASIAARPSEVRASNGSQDSRVCNVSLNGASDLGACAPIIPLIFSSTAGVLGRPHGVAPN